MLYYYTITWCGYIAAAKVVAVCSPFICHSVVFCSTPASAQPTNSKAKPHDKEYDEINTVSLILCRHLVAGTGLRFCVNLTLINLIFRLRPFIRFALHYFKCGVQCDDSTRNYFHSKSLKRFFLPLSNFNQFFSHNVFAAREYSIYSVFSLVVEGGGRWNDNKTH